MTDKSEGQIYILHSTLHRASLYDHKSGWISLLCGDQTGTGKQINRGDDTRGILFCLAWKVDQNRQSRHSVCAQRVTVSTPVLEELTLYLVLGDVWMKL